MSRMFFEVLNTLERGCWTNWLYIIKTTSPLPKSCICILNHNVIAKLVIQILLWCVLEVLLVLYDGLNFSDAIEKFKKMKRR